MDAAASGALLQYARGMHGTGLHRFHEQPDAQLLAYQRIIKQSGVVLAVYAPDLADGSAEDKAVSYALALGRPVMLIHPETLKTKWLNVPTEKAPDRLSRNQNHRSHTLE